MKTHDPFHTTHAACCRNDMQPRALVDVFQNSVPVVGIGTYLVRQRRSLRQRSRHQISRPAHSCKQRRPAPWHLPAQRPSHGAGLISSFFSSLISSRVVSEVCLKRRWQQRNHRWNSNLGINRTSSRSGAIACPKAGGTAGITRATESVKAANRFIALQPGENVMKCRAEEVAGSDSRLSIGVHEA